MQFFILAALAAVNSTIPSPSYLSSTGPPPTSSTPSYTKLHLTRVQGPSSPRPYAFNSAVNDYNGNDYSHSESSDGSVITDTYRLILLPDGRVQIVIYKYKSYGYNADVKYEGEAKYPEYKAASYSAPAYSTPAFSAPASSARYTAPAFSSIYYDNADVTYEGDAKYSEYETASYTFPANPAIRAYTGPAAPAVLATSVLN